MFIECTDKNEKQRLVNSTTSCINKNIEKIADYYKDNSFSFDRRNAAASDENLIDNLIELALNNQNVQKIFKDQIGKIYAAIKIG